jgi:hypothetical protein
MARHALETIRSASLDAGPPRGGIAGVLRHRAVRFAIAGWLLANLLTLVIAQGSLPFDRPLLENTSFADKLVSVNVSIVEAMGVIGLTVWLTRHRQVPDIAARLPALPVVRRETTAMIAYGAAALAGGIALGLALGTDPISFHLSGTLFGHHDHGLPSVSTALVWAGYNLIAYAAIPFAIFRRRSSPDAMLLTSSNRRNDLLVIAVVLLVESLVQVAALSSALFDLSPRQLVVGAPLTFGLYLLGTVLPTMIFVQAILVPRYLALTRSAPAAVVLGGLTYAAMHFPEAWMTFTSPGNVTLSVIFLIFVYFGPGMVKATLTLRTGNAWVHAWAYHAIAPHTLIDTPLIVRIFGIR